MSLSDDLLIILSSYSEGYRLMRARAYGFQYKHKRTARNYIEEASDGTLRVTLSRLKKRGLVETADRGVWKMTTKGREYLSKKLEFLRPSPKKFSKPAAKNMIVAFDIPEKEKKKRNWLRIELARLDFELLQKSLWFGPAPLPQEFLATLHDLQILPYLKFFKAESHDIV